MSHIWAVPTQSPEVGSTGPPPHPLSSPVWFTSDGQSQLPHRLYFTQIFQNPSNFNTSVLIDAERLKKRCWNMTDTPKSVRVPVVNHRYDYSTTAQPVLRSSRGSIFPSWFLINHHQTITSQPFGSSASVIIEELAKHVDRNICVP